MLRFARRLLRAPSPSAALVRHYRENPVRLDLDAVFDVETSSTPSPRTTAAVLRISSAIPPVGISTAVLIAVGPVAAAATLIGIVASVILFVLADLVERGGRVR